MLCLLDIRGYIWTGKKHFCFPVYLVATKASFVSANVTNCAVRYGTLLKCPTISLYIVQQTCFTKYRNEGQKTSLIERIMTVGEIYEFLGFQICKIQLRPYICHFFPTNILLGSIFPHMKNCINFAHMATFSTSHTCHMWKISDYSYSTSVM